MEGCDSLHLAFHCHKQSRLQEMDEISKQESSLLISSSKRLSEVKAVPCAFSRGTSCSGR